MNLTEVSYYFRKFLPFVLLFLIILLIFYYLLKLVLFFLSGPPPQTLYTDPIFGKISKPIINNASPSANLNFTIDTIEGKPISATDSAKVYFLPEASTRFGYREKVYLMAKTFGFDTNVVNYQLNGKFASFKDPNQTLDVDITNFNFDYEYKLANNPQVLSNSTVPNAFDSLNTATNFLKTIGRYPDELAQGKTNTIFLHYDPTQNKTTILQNSDNANMVEVDFYRPDQDQFSVVTPSFFNSQNYVMLIFYGSDYKVIKSQVKFFEKSDAQIGTYPLKSGDAVWSELMKGSGLVVQNPNGIHDVVIKQMFLGYFDPDVYQPYLEPVYVFLGLNNFVAYVPAVSSAYLGE